MADCSKHCIKFSGYIYLSSRAWGSRKVPGSIPGRVTGDFFRSIRQVHVPGVDSASKNEGKGGRYVGVTTLPPSRAECQEIWEP